MLCPVTDLFHSLSLSRPNQKHHGPLHFLRHLVTPLLWWHCLFYRFDHKTNFQQTVQDLGQGVVIFLHLIAQKVGGSFARVIVIRHGPGAVGSKLLVHTCREGRMLDSLREAFQERKAKSRCHAAKHLGRAESRHPEAHKQQGLQPKQSPGLETCVSRTNPGYFLAGNIKKHFVQIIHIFSC